MAIQDDIRIFPFSKTVRHVAGTTVYSVTAFYSFLMDFFDEPPFQSYEAPMKFNTPTSFSMLNGWFLDNGDSSDILQFLTGASINSIDYTTVEDPVYMLDLDATTDFTVADEDAEITDDAVAVGPLLAYKNDYPALNLARIWLRDTRATPLTIADNSVIATTGAGPGAGTAFGASLNGDEVYTNVFTLASFPGLPNPQPYIYQNHPQSAARVRIAEWSGLTNWDKATAGFDVLIPTSLGGLEIDGSNISTFIRQTGDSFTFVESDLTGGARTPLATETLSDAVNVDEGEYFLLYDASDTGSFTLGDIIQDTSNAPSATPATWYAEVVSVQEFTDASTGVIGIRSLSGTITDNDAIFVGTVQEALANGTPGDTCVSYDAATLDPVAADVGKGFLATGSGARRILRGFEVQVATTSGVLVFDANAGFGTIDTIDYNVAATHDALYIEPLDNDSWTGVGTATAIVAIADAIFTGFSNVVLISGFSDVTISHINGTVVVDTFVGTFEIGERLTWAGGGPAILAKTNASTSMTLANVEAEGGLNVNNTTITGQASGATCLINLTAGMTDANTATFAFTQQALFTYSVVVEGGAVYNTSRVLKDIYKYWQFYVRDGQNSVERIIWTSNGTVVTQVAAEEYIKAKVAYTATKPAPYGTLAGTLLFAAQGVWVQGTASVDDLRLTDDAGVAQQGTPSVLVQVTNTRVSDVVTVFLEAGASGLPDKTQFAMPGGEAVSGSTITVTGAIPVDTPSIGSIFVVDDSFAQADKEHRYRYDSFTGSIFTLKAEVPGTATAGTTGETLIDSGAPFSSTGTSRGDVIRNITDPAIGYIVSFDSTTQVTTTQMRSSTGAVVPWASGDTFEVNSIVNAIASADTSFVPYLDAVEDAGTDGSPGTVSDTLLFTGPRAVVVRVRNNLAVTEIVPFVTPSDITSGGMTVAVIRTEDTVTT